MKHIRVFECKFRITPRIEYEQMNVEKKNKIKDAKFTIVTHDNFLSWKRNVNFRKLFHRKKNVKSIGNVAMETDD